MVGETGNVVGEGDYDRQRIAEPHVCAQTGDIHRRHLEIVSALGPGGRVREKAEAEGMVVFYATTDTAPCIALTDAFMRLYPKINAQFVRTTGLQMAEKILAEARAGKFIWDVVVITPAYMQVFQEKGLIAAYDSPERRFYREGYKDRQGFWTSTYKNYAVFGFNTKLISKEKIPKTHDDLLKPEWRGQVGMEGKPFVNEGLVVAPLPATTYLKSKMAIYESSSIDAMIFTTGSSSRRISIPRIRG